MSSHNCISVLVSGDMACTLDQSSVSLSVPPRQVDHKQQGHPSCGDDPRECSQDISSMNWRLGRVLDSGMKQNLLNLGLHQILIQQTVC